MKKIPVTIIAFFAALMLPLPSGADRDEERYDIDDSERDERREDNRKDRDDDRNDDRGDDREEDRDVDRDDARNDASDDGRVEKRDISDNERTEDRR